nr:M20 family metallopeptidase [Spelaeicoccus albus]
MHITTYPRTMSNQPEPVNRYFSEQMSRDTRARAEAAEPPSSRFAGAPRKILDRAGAAVDTEAGRLIALSHSLHANPETAFDERESARAIIRLLADSGVSAELGVHGLETAIRSEFVRPGTPEDAPAIAILAEYDALPEIGHGCGHNVIAAAGVGAYLAVRSALAEGDPAEAPGRVVFLGTPAEEGNSGKEYMARAGAFDGIDAAVMVHPYGYDVAEQVWLGRRLMSVTFHGAAAHASAQPFMGRNALDAATLAYHAVGLLRQQMLPVDRVHAVISEGGTRPSIIPETAEMKLYARSKYPETLKSLSDRLTKIAEGAAMMTGTGVDIEWDDKPASLPVRTNGALTGRWAVAQSARGRQSLPLGVVPETIAASTDFGNISYRLPGIHPLIKIADAGTALHTREFAEAAAGTEADEAVRDGAYGLAAVVLDYLADGDLRDAVDQEFEDQGGAVDVPRFFD